MVRAIVTGACGRMGKRIIGIIHETNGITLKGAVERSGHPSLGKDVGELLGIGSIGVRIESHLDDVIQKGDVIIDFTTPDTSLKHLEIAVSHGKAIVIGTTGFSTAQRSHIKGLASKTRCLLSPNMSLGINVLLKILPDITRALGSDYDIEIIEAHHRLKKDAPSGTAMRMAEVLATALDRDLERVAVYERKGIIGERGRDEMGIQTIRAGDIVGDHTIIFGGLGERIEITHRAHSRDTFARGAVKAAIWLVEQKNGLYDMHDVLSMK